MAAPCRSSSMPLPTAPRCWPVRREAGGGGVSLSLARKLCVRPDCNPASPPLCLHAGPSNDVDPTVMHTLKPTAFWAAMERRYGRVPELVRGHRVGAFVMCAHAHTLEGGGCGGRQS